MRRLQGQSTIAAALSVIVAGLFAVRLPAGEVDYLRDIKPLLKVKCYACHGSLKQESDLRLDTVAQALLGGASGEVLTPGDATASELFRRVSSDDPSDRMPPEGEPLTNNQLKQLQEWIESGATSPPDEQPQTNPREHWAFLPLASSPPGATIDTFIDRRLQAAGLSANNVADRRTLVRRLFLDLHGLPPAPEQISAFVEDDRPGSWQRLVDDVLASPRYGERWAQHWLDLVRYADTHGFEVNTPRENAWPYRDYVIAAFNRDLPYDQFIRQQIAGDALGVDAATGFLVAAPVLLPGQIGKDAASMRQARQDELDEIIISTSATFLGLTVGCARCHDHKFDPISQKDYYALQAFFSGVKYGERPIHDADFSARKARALALQPRIDELDAELREFEPLRRRGRTLRIDDQDRTRVAVLQEPRGQGTNPEGDQPGYRDDAGSGTRSANVSGGRYTWWTNTTGEDVLAYQPAISGRFEVWISWGVHGSGVHTRDARYVLDRDGDRATRDDQQEIARVDQYYPAGVDDGETPQQPLWSGFQSAGIHDLTDTSQLLVRGGQTGTGITADVVVLQEVDTADDLPAAEVPPLRAPVDPRQNVERITPQMARFVRFTTLATVDENRHEPCIDELEVYAVDAARNLALAVHGTQASSSGDFSTSGKHQLPHINDGLYGNSRSWISDEKGAGWVQLELPESVLVERIVWGRDRDGTYQDRLPVRYRIEVSQDGERWTLVADQTDRAPVGSPHQDLLCRLRNAPGTQADRLEAMAGELAELQTERDELLQVQHVYGGVFGAADQTQLLSRGDPEQPIEPVSPQVPALFGVPALPESAGDRERRRALVDWVTAVDNPLTARVMVNRIWQSHFGHGLVETASDFGLNGTPPSHPDLLDWLAQQFIESGWSVKHLHRLILASGAYRRSSAIVPAAMQTDSNNRLLWRFTSRRLEAEAIRDSILCLSGDLNLAMGGPGFNLFQSRGGLSGFPPVENFGPDQWRRMIYAHKVRMEPAPVFGAFDCPDAGQPMPKRSRSTTAIQALNLFNSPFVIEQAEHMAHRIERDLPSGTVDAFVESAFRQALGRRPTPSEQQAAVALAGQQGLVPLCRALFNSNEFLFLP